jgi:hypothetical protein
MIYNKSLYKCYRIVIMDSVSSKPKMLGARVYRGHSQQRENLTPNKETHSNPLIAIYKTYRSYLVLLLLLLLLAIPMPSYGASYSPDALRVYAHSRIVNWSEFRCFDKIIYKESRWNYLARNGSHYGLGQMRSKYYQSKDPFTQIDLTIAYTLKRYSTICNGWLFHSKHGYY